MFVFLFSLFLSKVNPWGLCFSNLKTEYQYQITLILRKHFSTYNESDLFVKKSQQADLKEGFFGLFLHISYKIISKIQSHFLTEDQFFWSLTIIEMKSKHLLFSDSKFSNKQASVDFYIFKLRIVFQISYISIQICHVILETVLLHYLIMNHCHQANKK